MKHLPTRRLTATQDEKVMIQNWRDALTVNQSGLHAFEISVGKSWIIRMDKIAPKNA